LALSSLFIFCNGFLNARSIFTISVLRFFLQENGGEINKIYQRKKTNNTIDSNVVFLNRIKKNKQ